MVVKIGNLFESSAQTLVNTVNCVGVMGKGIALDFKKKYPLMYDEYVRLCKQHEVKPGKPYYYSDLTGASIIVFPTKDHWRSPSKLSYIVDGLTWFRENYQQLGIKSIAFPPLGCGNGGLSWSVVGPVMYRMLADLPIEIEVFAPFGTKIDQLTENYLIRNFKDFSMDTTGAHPLPVNKYWLLIPYVIQQLNRDKYSLNVGRTIFQKVCYVLTRVGIPTGFQFSEGSYGPFSRDVEEARAALSNANILTEQQLGRMTETVVSSSFQLPKDQFTEKDFEKVKSSIDLLSRIKSTDHAEMIATVMFSFDELEAAKQTPIKDTDVFDHVMNWKKRWVGIKDKEVSLTIIDLATLHWITPVSTGNLPISLDDLFQDLF